MNIIKRTVKPKVCGNPVRMLDPFHLIKTTIFFIVIAGNNSFSQLKIDPKLYNKETKNNIETKNNKEYIDGLELLPEKTNENIPVIEAPKQRSTGQVYTYDRNTQNLLRDSLIKPMPTEETQGHIFGVIYQNGEFEICHKAPEPTTGSLFLLSGIILTYIRRKMKNNDIK